MTEERTFDEIKRWLRSPECHHLYADARVRGFELYVYLCDEEFSLFRLYRQECGLPAMYDVEVTHQYQKWQIRPTRAAHSYIECNDLGKRILDDVTVVDQEVKRMVDIEHLFKKASDSQHLYNVPKFSLPHTTFPSRMLRISPQRSPHLLKYDYEPEFQYHAPEGPWESAVIEFLNHEKFEPDSDKNYRLLLSNSYEDNNGNIRVFFKVPFK